jgi:hypothetical protein
MHCYQMEERVDPKRNLPTMLSETYSELLPATGRQIAAIHETVTCVNM